MSEIEKNAPIVIADIVSRLYRGAVQNLGASDTESVSPLPVMATPSFAFLMGPLFVLVCVALM